MNPSGVARYNYPERVLSFAPEKGNGVPKCPGRKLKKGENKLLWGKPDVKNYCVEGPFVPPCLRSEAKIRLLGTQRLWLVQSPRVIGRK